MNINLIIETSNRTKEWALSFTFSTEKEALEAVKHNGYALKYVNDQSEAVCLEAVKYNGDALKYVDFSKEESKNHVK